MNAVKKLFFTTLLTLTCICGTLFCGCDKTKETKATNTGEILLSFESVREISSMTIYKGVNKAEFNRDEKYISDGKASFRLCPKVSPKEGKYEDAYVAFYGTNSSFFTKTNFSDCNYLSVDVYNPSQTDYQLVWGATGLDNDFYTVKPGWNTLYKYIDRAMLDYRNKGYIELLSFSFGGRTEKEGALDVYIDNIRYYQTEQPFEKFQPTGKELINFSNSIESCLFTVENQSASLLARCRLTNNKDPRYFITGTGSLQVTAGLGEVEYPDKPLLSIDRSLLPDFSKYLNDGWYFTLPIYNGCDSAVTCVLTFASAIGEYSLTFNIPANSWGEEYARIGVDFIKSQFAGSGLDIAKISIRFEGMEAGESVYIDCIGVTK